MKVKLICDDQKKEQLLKEIKSGAIEIDDKEFDIVIIDPDYSRNDLVGRNESQEYEIVSYQNIYFVESYGHDIFVHTKDSKLQVREKLYEIEGMFEDKGFIRVHRSYVINKKYIKSIKPTFNTKFIITLKNDVKIEVSRSYYYIFKSRIGL